MNKIYLNINFLKNNLKLITFLRNEGQIVLGENIQFDRSEEQHLEVTL